MSAVDNNAVIEHEVKQEITLADIASRLDNLGAQMNWLVENLSSLFGFVTQMSQNGGGIRGLMKAMKTEAPELSTMEGTPDAG